MELARVVRLADMSWSAAAGSYKTDTNTLGLRTWRDPRRDQFRQVLDTCRLPLQRMLGAVAGFHDPAQYLPRIFSELVNFLTEIGTWSGKVNGALSLQCLKKGCMGTGHLGPQH